MESRLQAGKVINNGLMQIPQFGSLL
jgi:hypothetical protein